MAKHTVKIGDRVTTVKGGVKSTGVVIHVHGGGNIDVSPVTEFNHASAGTVDHWYSAKEDEKIQPAQPHATSVDVSVE